MKIKLKFKGKDQIMAFHSYLKQVQTLICNKKDKLQGKKVTNDFIQINVTLLEIDELISRSALLNFKASLNLKKSSTINISPIQGYIITAYLSEYQKFGCEKKDDYVSFFIKEQSAIIWKELLTN